jgi:peptidoglycan/xylan/chitin deacetylase (PgdA/CDA1 family)
VKVHLTFDVEVWCGGWSALDERFPSRFERYVYGHSPAGDYALPKTLEILDRHGLRGVFFVEPLFSARFGAQHLATVAGLITAAGQDVQLHLHPEWTDEITPPLLPGPRVKRQHLVHYSRQEQAALIGWGRHALEAAVGRPVHAFRAGSYAANADTYAALADCGLAVDSSFNETADFAGGALAQLAGGRDVGHVGAVTVYPVTVFLDGFGRLRQAQVGACGFAELRAALRDARRRGAGHFVIVSHNFELMKPDSSQPDPVVVRRFERLCAFLAAQGDAFEVAAFPAGAAQPCAEGAAARARVPASATAVRLAEQAWRRLG